MGMLERIASAVFGISVTPPVPPGQKIVLTPEPAERRRDLRDDRSGLSYFIHYDGGSLSQRRITVRRLQINNNAVTHILAHCHERSQIRLFRTDRIAEAHDVQTGEIFTSSQLCSALLDRGIPVAEMRLQAMVRILVFMARCDGHAHHLEWEEIDRSIIRLSRCLTDDESGIEDLLADARRLAPDHVDFVRALRSLTKTRLPDRMLQELRRSIGAVVDADGIHHQNEVTWAVQASEYIMAMPRSD